MELSAEIIREMSRIVDNNDAMSRLLKYVKKLVRQTQISEIDNEAISEKELLIHIEKGIKDIKLAKQGKINLKTAEELLNEL